MAARIKTGCKTLAAERCLPHIWHVICWHVSVHAWPVSKDDVAIDDKDWGQGEVQPTRSHMAGR